MFSIDRESVPYSWNHTISYDPSKGKMPYLVEMLHATAISALYHPLEEVLEYSIQASISKGECARGLKDSVGMVLFSINLDEMCLFFVYFITLQVLSHLQLKSE